MTPNSPEMAEKIWGQYKINSSAWQNLLESTPPSKSIEDRRDPEAERYDELWHIAKTAGNTSGKTPGKGNRELTKDESEWLVDYAIARSKVTDKKFSGTPQDTVFARWPGKDAQVYTPEAKKFLKEVLRREMDKK